MATHLLSRLDLRSRETVRDLRHELRRAGDDPAKLAAWSAKWGDAVVAHLEATISKEPGAYRLSTKVAS